MFRSFRWLSVALVLAGIGANGCSSSSDPVAFNPLPSQVVPSPTPSSGPGVTPTPQITPTPGTPGPDVTPTPTVAPTTGVTPVPGTSPTPIPNSDPTPDPNTSPNPTPGPVIVLNTTVPDQAAGRFQISVQISPDQLGTSTFSIPPVDSNDPDVVFERTSIEFFPGFTTFGATLDTSFVLVSFDQLEIPGVTNGDCVILHEPGLDPLIQANQDATSQGCT